MIRLFFHRSSPIVKILLILLLTFTLIYFYQGRLQPLSIVQKTLYLFSLFQIGLNLFYYLYPWHSKKAAGPGIRLHFQQSMVAVTYLWLINTLSMYFFSPWIGILLPNLLLLPISYVGSLIIWIYFQDVNRALCNELSGSKNMLS